MAPFHSTVEPGSDPLAPPSPGAMNPEPITERVGVPAMPATDAELIVGTGNTEESSTMFEVSAPPTEGLNTTNWRLGAKGAMTVVSCVALTNVVGKLSNATLPAPATLTCTTELALKPEPLTVN